MKGGGDHGHEGSHRSPPARSHRATCQRTSSSRRASVAARTGGAARRTNITINVLVGQRWKLGIQLSSLKEAPRKPAVILQLISSELELKPKENE